MKLTTNTSRDLGSKIKVGVVEEEWTRSYYGEIRVHLDNEHVMYFTADEARAFADELQAAYYLNLGRIAQEQAAAAAALKEKREAEAAAAKAEQEAGE